MNTKEIKKAMLMASVPFMLLSCKDDGLYEKGLQTGKEVQFSVSTKTDQLNTRTWYGKPFTDNDGTIVVSWPINWNTESMGYDEIFVYGPNAMAGRETGIYQIKNPNNENTSTTEPITISMVGTSGVQWGDKETYFYGLYPASIQSGFGGTKLNATMLGDQTAIPLNVPTTNTPNEEAANYTFRGDMEGCVMAAKTSKAYAPNTTEAINLTFSPITTCLNIIVTGPMGNIKNPVHVTSVSVEADVQISGDFSFDFDGTDDPNTTYDDRVTLIPSGNKDKDNSVEVHTLCLIEGAQRGIPLNTEQQNFTVQAFILPNPDISKLSVSVHTAEGYTWTKTLVLGSDNAYFKQGQINQVTLPKLDGDKIELDYSTWISQLDPRIYISDLSLPGTALSFINNNTVRSTGGTGALSIDNSHVDIQQSGLADQLKAGIRVFQAQIWMDGETSDIDGDPGRIIIVGPNGNPIYKNGTTTDGLKTAANRFTLYDALKIMQDELIASHGNEFCVLMLSDVGIDRSKSVTGIQEGKMVNGQEVNYTLEDLYSKLYVVSRYLSNPERGQGQMLPDVNINPNTTIFDVQNKIILKFQLNANIGTSTTGSNTHCTDADAINKGIDEINYFSKLAQSEALFNVWSYHSGNELIFSPLIYGDDIKDYGGWGSFTYTAASGGVGASGITLPSNPVGTGVCANIAKQMIDNLRHQTVLIVTYTMFDNPYGETFYTKNSASYNLWYIYGEQVNPNNSSNLTGATGNVGRMGTAIDTYYTLTSDPADAYKAPNKYYMTYLGGQGDGSTSGNYTFSAITNSLNAAYWGSGGANSVNGGALKTLLDKSNLSVKAAGTGIATGPYIDDSTPGDYVNLGWVLVNNISLNDVMNPNTDNISARIVQTVIQNNGLQNRLLHRASEVGGTKASQSTEINVNNITNGGSLFKSRRR